MKTRNILAAAILGGTLGAQGQNGLRDIPDPDVKGQLASFKLPEGAKINLFASDPMISKPIHMNWDGEGRLWIVSSPMYPHIEPGQPEVDKLFVIEDTDGDGVADKSTEFADNLYIPTAVLPGDGGVYVANSTEMIFIRDTDGDGKGDERRVVLSGFGTEDTHHLLHTFRWGPEGMLWMNQSIYIHSHVETPYGVRRLLGGGMWHFRPETGRLEVFMKGLVNSWGHVFDDWGQSFMTDGAGGNGINYVFPRSVFQASPGAARTLRGLNPGQPKHCSLEVVTGRHVPEDWVGTLLAPDFRGHRINRFKLTDKGSAYTSTQVEDLVSSSHRAFRPIDVKMGPDGAIYVADWYNPIIQHGEVDFRDPRRDHTHGRIWRITFPGRELVKPPKIAGATPEELVKGLDAPEGWTRTQVAAELRNRDPKDVMPVLEKWQASLGAGEDLGKLRAVWGSQALGADRKDWAVALLSSGNHKARAGALRALYYGAADETVERSLLEKAVVDPNSQVRLWAVSVLAQQNWPDTVAVALRALEGGEVDQFLDFAVWSICREHAARWVPLAEKKNPFTSVKQLQFAAAAIKQPVGVARVLAALRSGEFKEEAEIAEVAAWVAQIGRPEHVEALFVHAFGPGKKPAEQAIVLHALAEAARVRKLAPSKHREFLQGFLKTRDGRFIHAAALAGRWKVESVRPLLEQAFLEGSKDAGRARAAVEGLQALGGGKTAAFLGKVAGDESAPFERRALAVAGLTRVNQKAAAALAVVLLQGAKGEGEVRAVVDAFLTNKQGPGLLEAELRKAKVSLSEEVALAGMNRAASAATRPEGLVKAFQEAGGLKPMKLQLSPKEMEAMMARVAEKGDARRGETIYRRANLQCIVCHAVGGVGGVIGPDLVSIGSSAPVDYLVESLLEPSKKIKEGYHTTLVTTKTGDTFAGAIAREDGTEVVVRDATGAEHRVSKAQIASKVISPVSLMPPGLTASLREDEFVDLVRFLSELGRDGPYATSSNRYVRHWEVLEPHERTRDAIGHYGAKIFAEEIKTYVWSPMVAKVGGGLPSDELPEVVGRGRNRYAVGRFFLEVSQAGPVELKVDGVLKDLHLFVGESEIKLPASGESTTLSVDLKPGRHKITVSGLRGFGLEDVRVELPGDAGTVQVLKP